MAEHRHLRLASQAPDPPSDAPSSTDDLARLIRLVVAEVLAQQGGTRPSPLLTLNEAAARLGCSLTSVKGLVRRNELPVSRFRGRLVRVRQSDLDALIDERSSSAAAQPYGSP